MVSQTRRSKSGPEVRAPLLNPERQPVVPVNGLLNTVEIIAARFACRLLIGMILHEVFWYQIFPAKLMNKIVKNHSEFVPWRLAICENIRRRRFSCWKQMLQILFKWPWSSSMVWCLFVLQIDWGSKSFARKSCGTKTFEHPFSHVGPR